MPALASFLIEDDGSVTEKTVEHYRRRAAGGPAMVIVEAHAVSPEGIVSNHQARIYDDRFIEGLSKIARVMKSEGAVPAIQIHHGGRQTSARVIKQKPFAPSNLPCPTIRGDVEPLGVEGIQRIVRHFGQAAGRAVEAGFELIEIHGAHGYLINQFLSRFSNIREDRYGGDPAGRALFSIEIVKEIRRKIGKGIDVEGFWNRYLREGRSGSEDRRIPGTTREVAGVRIRHRGGKSGGSWPGGQIHTREDLSPFKQG